MSEQIDQTSELPWDKHSVSVRDTLIVVGVIVFACILTVSLLVYVFQENSEEVIASSASPAGDSMRGEALFTGAIELQNGAPTCITCHRRAGFGPLGPGPDLTEVHKRYGEAGLPQTLQNLPFASMQGMFGNRPLTDSEVADLNAYFAQTKQASKEEYSKSLQAYFDDMSTILLNEDLDSDKVQITIRARTLSVLEELDPEQKASVVNYVSDVELISWILIDADLNRASLNEINLSGANLSGANLNGADLFRTNLSGANLQGTKLFGAILTEADLRDANLVGADLSRSEMSRADLTNSDMTGAFMGGADLIEADLREALLTRATLIGTNLSRADLNNADLSGAIYDSKTKWPDDIDPAGAGAIYHQ